MISYYSEVLSKLGIFKGTVVVAHTTRRKGLRISVFSRILSSFSADIFGAYSFHNIITVFIKLLRKVQFISKLRLK